MSDGWCAAVCVCLRGTGINGIFLFIVLLHGVSHDQHAERKIVSEAGLRRERETLHRAITAGPRVVGVRVTLAVLFQSGRF